MSNNDELHKKTDETITTKLINDWFKMANDVTIFPHTLDKQAEHSSIVFIYSNGMIDNSLIYKFVLPEVHELYQATNFSNASDMNDANKMLWKFYDTKGTNITSEWISNYIFEGMLLLFVPHLQSFWMINLANVPKRQPTDSASEVSIRGSKDGFIEHLETNISLIRKRLKTTNLACEYFEIGQESKTKTALLYMSDIANPDTAEQIRSKLEEITLEKLISTGQLEELLAPSKFAIFPTSDYTGRADFAAQCLMSGRFIILLDNNPTAIIIPVNLFLLMKSPEDMYYPLISVMFGRIIRVVGLWITIFLPGLYIAFTTYHSDQIPFTLLATISLGRHGLPMESPIEMFFIMSLMELFREAGIRMPSSVGQTLTVVGGLIIGDAAIRAGIVSPLMIVISAITVVSGATLVNQLLTSSTTLLRYTSFFLSSIFGMYGFMLSLIAFIAYMTNIRSFGVSYLSPLAPLKLSELLAGILKAPIQWNNKRPHELHSRKPRRKKDKK
ncbi:spore germination protein [Paenibacillus yanchengensis]|uniref:Spore germination protein n=1 Tax=Paenibacillus yanchengensis TaxID=2035833 RepID=A0ABW4YF82_9BACL